jgi:hypothetical protein
MPTFRNTLSVPSSQACRGVFGTECYETSAFKTQAPGNYPKEIIQHSKHGESLKSRINKSITALSEGIFSRVSKLGRDVKDYDAHIL